MKICRIFRRLAARAFNAVDEIYQTLASALLYVGLRPIVRLAEKRLQPESFQTVCFRMIDGINCLFPIAAYKQKRLNALKKDIRRYRDTYDRRGLDAYFALLSPEELIGDKVVLDLGCGVGGKTAELLKYGPRNIVGLDLSKRNIAIARELITDRNRARISFVSCNLLAWRENGAFDSIVSYTAFEHIDKDSLGATLQKMYDLLKPGGRVEIVFNHYHDRFGSHLKEYIYHPWPQTLFPDGILYSYWNIKRRSEGETSPDSYYPGGYEQGRAGDTDCFMSLNKLSIAEFEAVIRKTPFLYEGKHLYSKSCMLALIPFLPGKYLIGSAVYLLRKPSP